MNRRLLFLLTIIVFSVPLFSQNSSDYIAEIQDSTNDDGSISIIQDDRIHFMVNTYISTVGGRTIRGYRIRIFSDSGIDAKEKAEYARTKFLRNYPYDEYEMHSYIKWVPPNFKVYIGDFRTKNEALRFQRIMTKTFPYAFYVSDNINLPKL